MLYKKDQVVQSLNIMLKSPYPGGVEEDFLKEHPRDESGTVNCCSGKEFFHKYVKTSRNVSAVRFKIVMSAINLLNERINDDQQKLVTTMKVFFEFY